MFVWFYSPIWGKKGAIIPNIHVKQSHEILDWNQLKATSSHSFTGGSMLQGIMGIVGNNRVKQQDTQTCLTEQKIWRFADKTFNSASFLFCFDLKWVFVRVTWGQLNTICHNTHTHTALLPVILKASTRTTLKWVISTCLSVCLSVCQLRQKHSSKSADKQLYSILWKHFLGDRAPQFFTLRVKLLFWKAVLAKGSLCLRQRRTTFPMKHSQ